MFLEPGKMRIRHEKVVRYANGEESIYEKEYDYLEAHPNETVFIKPILDSDKYTLVVVVDPFYGIRYQDRSAIMKSVEKRDKIFNEIQNFAINKISSVPNSISQRNYLRQEEEQQKKRRLQNLVPRLSEQMNN
ncbi:MAG: hypothetical protein J1F35_03210 [Erysipelotrichales bacterium]|nr:hypothetical protein [Erysipelotrichales bacterium]